MSSANLNKQRLDELLGIVTEMQKSDSGIKEYMTGVNEKNPIPNDVPTDGSSSASNPPVAQPPPSPPVVSAAKPQAIKQGGIDMMLEEQDNMALAQTSKSLNEIDSLLATSKDVVQHVYTVVTSTDILDAATITACANLIKETKALIQEHLEIQRSQREFLNKVQMEEIKHQHQMQLMEKKFELEQKRLQAKKPPIQTSGGVQPVASQTVSGGLKTYSSADLMKMVNEE